jgi:hypothetical protein
LPEKKEPRTNDERLSLKYPNKKKIGETLKLLADPDERTAAKVEILNSFEEELAVPFARYQGQVNCSHGIGLAIAALLAAQ